MTVAATSDVYQIIDNIDVFLDDDYTMSTFIAGADIDQSATVLDDDTAVLPKTPDANITVLNAKYKNAYIEFTEDPSARDNNNIFVATLGAGSTELADKGLENADLSPASDFLLAIIVTCYQSHHDLSPSLGSLPNATVADADPDVRYHMHGGSPTTGDQALRLAATPGTTQNVSAFYLETNLDYLSQVAAGYFPGHILRTLQFKEPRTIAHELGHQFGISTHTPGTLVSPWDGGDYDLDATQIAQVRDSNTLIAH